MFIMGHLFYDQYVLSSQIFASLLAKWVRFLQEKKNLTSSEENGAWGKKALWHSQSRFLVMLWSEKTLPFQSKIDSGPSVEYLNI